MQKVAKCSLALKFIIISSREERGCLSAKFFQYLLSLCILPCSSLEVTFNDSGPGLQVERGRPLGHFRPAGGSLITANRTRWSEDWSARAIGLCPNRRSRLQRMVDETGATAYPVGRRTSALLIQSWKCEVCGSGTICRMCRLRVKFTRTRTFSWVVPMSLALQNCGTISHHHFMIRQFTLALFHSKLKHISLVQPTDVHLWLLRL